ncbi:hypothetical protein K504DRAFT_493372 [Pleomassaria siparia CBS 279.74]|uniref:Uncharacterized protein n=1 Tax=Pleomassaria siparia CBS 279.74 TaxID=1314801 RepID=A0A6G1K0R9_9PLEO|nr:hypothetical protein K504DRAFT_493372 [Pleomassaria siparia CBS 279.74]
MASLIIEVTGSCTIQCLAEHGTLKIADSSTEVAQAKPTEDVPAACETLQQIFTTLAPKNETGHFAPDAAITGIPYSRGEEPEKPREYRAQCSFEATFKYFAILGNVTEELISIPFVEVKGMEWQLTEETKAIAEVESRKGAMRDAVRKANEIAEVIGREVSYIEVKGDGSQISSSRGLFSQELGNPSDIICMDWKKLKVEPDALKFNTDLVAKFAAE